MGLGSLSLRGLVVIVGERVALTWPLQSRWLPPLCLAIRQLDWARGERLREQP